MDVLLSLKKHLNLKQFEVQIGLKVIKSGHCALRWKGLDDEEYGIPTIGNWIIC
jgi:hypothetical protein